MNLEYNWRINEDLFQCRTPYKEHTLKATIDAEIDIYFICIKLAKSLVGCTFKLILQGDRLVQKVCVRRMKQEIYVKNLLRSLNETKTMGKRRDSLFWVKGKYKSILLKRGHEIL